MIFKRLQSCSYSVKVSELNLKPRCTEVCVGSPQPKNRSSIGADIIPSHFSKKDFDSRTIQCHLRNAALLEEGELVGVSVDLGTPRFFGVTYSSGKLSVLVLDLSRMSDLASSGMVANHLLGILASAVKR